MKRLFLIAILSVITFFLGVGHFGQSFYEFLDSLFEIFPWFVVLLGALSYPFYNYVDGIGKDIGSIPEALSKEQMGEISRLIDELKKEIIENVVLALMSYLAAKVLISCVDFLGLMKIVAYPICLSLLAVSIAAFFSQAIGFRTAAEMRGLVMRRKMP